MAYSNPSIRAFAIAEIIQEKGKSMEAYCVKCKAKKEMKNPVEGVTKNGRIIFKDKCPDCGTTINRIGGAAKKD